MAKVLKIRRNRSYRWLKSSEDRAQRASEELLLIQEIKDIQEDSRYSLGTPRITEELHKKDYPVNHKKVARLLKENSLNHRMKEKFKVTTDSNHKHLVSPNLLNQDFSASKPNQKWVSDFAYIWAGEGWVTCV